VTDSKRRATSFTFDVTQPVRSVQIRQAIGVLPIMPWKILAATSGCATLANVSNTGGDERCVNGVILTFRSAER